MTKRNPTPPTIKNNSGTNNSREQNQAQPSQSSQPMARVTPNTVPAFENYHSPKPKNTRMTFDSADDVPENKKK